jgi:hypothetical protein
MDSAITTTTPTPVEVGARRVDRPSSIWLLAVGGGGGFTLGVVARVWMRLISDDPEFSWNGTIFIVAAFTITGLGHGLVWSVRRARRRRRWSTVARLAGAVLTMPLFVGAGALMLPTVVAGSMATWRRDWVAPVRWLLCLLSVAVPVSTVVDVWSDGLTGWSLLGLVLFVATYALVIASMRAIVAPLDDGWRTARWARVALIVGGVLGLLLVAVSAVGVVTATD